MAITDNIAGAYNCEDNAANTTVTDSSGSNDGTASTNTSNITTTGKVNNGFVFDGSTEYFTVPNGVLNWAGDFTISFWFKNNSDTAMCFVGTQTGGTSGFTIDYNVNAGAGNLGATFAGKGNSAAAWTPDNNWNHVFVTYNATDDDLIVYLNNSVHASNLNITAPPNNSAAIGIGRRESIGDSYFDGSVDGVYFWDRVITSDERDTVYNSGNGAEYPFTEDEIDEDDTTTLSDSLTINRNAKTFLIDEDDTTTLSDSLTIERPSRIFSLDVADTTNISDSLAIAKVIDQIIDEDDTVTLNDTLTLVPVLQAEGVKVEIQIDGQVQSDVKSSVVERSQNEFNTISSFSIKFDNVAGRHNDDFEINQEVNILADIDKNPETVIINGVIDDIDFSGSGTKEVLTVSGREFGSVLQDIIVSPRIFKDTEVSSIVNSLMSQNVKSITTNNVNVTTTTVDKITFTNISVFDALIQLAEISGYFFYVDTDKDLHFEQKNSTSSGVTLDNTNSNSARFTTSDSDQYTKVTVQGDRQLTGAESIQTTGTDNTGSVYVLDAKPYNTLVTLSGASNTVLQPGGIVNINDPATDNVKYLVDFQGQTVTLTSGTAAGDNIQANGSVVIFNYQRSTPVLSVKQIASNFPKHKIITDRNIKDIDEASTKAQTFLDEHKDVKVQGRVDVKSVLDVTPGHTVLVNLPNQGQNNQTYAITNAKYEFNPTNIQSQRILSLKLNRKISDFVDIMKEQILRLRAIESSETDSSITNLELGSSVVGVRNINRVISTSIGSAFYFHTPNHNILNSPSSLLGDMRTGSTVFENGIKI